MLPNSRKRVVATGVGEDIQRLGEQTQLPSVELVYLADKWLGRLAVTQVYSGMGLGWEQALTKAAFRRSVPFSAIVPGCSYQDGWPSEAQDYCQKLARFAERVEVIPSSVMEAPVLSSHTRWMIDQSDLLIVLWDFDFSGRVFAAVDHAIKKGKEVVNLWEEWRPLRSMRTRHVLG